MPPAFSVVRVHLLPCVHMSAWYWLQGCCSELGFLSVIHPGRPQSPKVQTHSGPPCHPRNSGGEGAALRSRE